MSRTGVLYCALGGLVGLTVGCNLCSSGTGAIKDRDEAVLALNAKLDKLDKKIAALKNQADKATGEDKDQTGS
jgi:hypothetical protein